MRSCRLHIIVILVESDSEALSCWYKFNHLFWILELLPPFFLDVILPLVVQNCHVTKLGIVELVLRKGLFDSRFSVRIIENIHVSIWIWFSALNTFRTLNQAKQIWNFNYTVMTLVNRKLSQLEKLKIDRSRDIGKKVQLANLANATARSHVTVKVQSKIENC